jgi:hypothetical protein
MRVSTMFGVVPILLAHVGCGPAGGDVQAKVAAGAVEPSESQRAADEKARRDAVSAERKRVADEQAKYRDDERGLGSSCQDVAALEAAAAAIRQQEPSDATCPKDGGVRGPGRDGRLTREEYETFERCDPIADRRRADEYVASEYDKLAQDRRAERVRGITGEIGSWLKAFVPLQDVDNPAQVRDDIPKTKALVEDLRCYDAAAAAKAQADVDAWASAREKAIADEEACRADPACMGARVAAPLCEAVAGRRGVLQDIARHRAKAGGASDATVLHDLGLQVKEYDATIAELRGKYTAITHKGFSDASCRKPR